MTKAIEGGEKEGGSLAGTRLCGCHDVRAAQNSGDGLCLHGGRSLVSKVFDGLENVLGKVK
jgi:hypothetical protein